MALHRYDTQESRLKALSGAFIGHALPTEVLGGCGIQQQMPKNKTDTIILSSWVPFGGTASSPNIFSVNEKAHLTREGVTPKPDSITRRDISIKLNEYAALYAFTSKDWDMYEDNIAEAMKEQIGERMGLVRELAIYGQMKASTNKSYAGGSSATTRATVSGKITPLFLQRMVRSLKNNHAKFVTKILDPSGNIGTSYVEAAYVAYAHTDCEQDIYDLPGFLPVAGYGTRKTISDFEIGTWQKIRFVLSPELNSYPDAATSITASTYGLKTTTGTNPDVYPLIVVSQDCFAQVAMRGKNAVDAIFLDNKPSKSDPLGMRGYIGAKFWHGSAIANSGWLAVGECGVSDLIG